MPWNPDIYNQFKTERYQPFYDLIEHLKPNPDMNIIDLGCGTGELTKIVADRFSPKKILGIDSSAEMLHKVPHAKALSFAHIDIEDQLEKDESWDVIIANASLQWIDDHQNLFANIISKLLPNGQLAVQMPSQKENVLNQLLDELVHQSPYFELLQNEIRYSPVLTLDAYTQLLFAQGAKDALVYQKVYPIIAQSTDQLYDFISGSALVPYMEKLSDNEKSVFVMDFKKKIESNFKSLPAVYPFKRLFLVARFS